MHVAEHAQQGTGFTLLAGHKYLWQLRVADAHRCQHLAKALGISLPIATTLVARGFDEVVKAQQLLFSDKARDLACASQLKDAVRVVTRIEEAIAKNQKILIFGDYDVDGMTATSIALLALRPLGAQINYFLPDRVKDGYGISAVAVEKAVEAGYQLIITVDNGTTAHAAANMANKLGIDIIITDHHQPKSALPEVFALVNPHQADCSYPSKNFCGAGVIFKLMELLYQRRQLALPEKIYELLMMGTIADMVPLDAENRYWIRHGIGRLKLDMSYAFFCLARNAGINPAQKNFWSAQDIGFFIAPQLNALGRLENPRAAVKFLISEKAEEIEAVAIELKAINDKRKTVDRAIFAEIDRQIKTKKIDLSKQSIIFAAHHDWPAGVIGLVAGKLMAAYGRPTFLFHLTADGIAKGSCRSIEQFNVFKALEQCHELLIAFGGHSCAAGLSLPVEHLPELQRRLEALLQATVEPKDLVPKLQVDAVLHLPDAGLRLLHDMRLLEPFGMGNPVPVFLLSQVVLVKAPELLKELHLKCMVFAEGVVKPVIFFNRPELLSQLQALEDRPFDIVATLSANEWEGQTRVEFIGLDVRFDSV